MDTNCTNDSHTKSSHAWGMATRSKEVQGERTIISSVGSLTNRGTHTQHM